MHSPITFRSEAVAGKTFDFERSTGEYLGTMTLLQGGDIGGYRNDNEYAWRISKDGSLELLDRTGHVRTVFRSEDAYGTLIGTFDGIPGWHRLREVIEIEQVCPAEKLRLPTVTLVCVDCVNPSAALEAMDHSMRFCEFGATKFLTSLPVDDLRTVRIDALNSMQEYSRFMIERLACHVDTEHMLVVQHDGFVCNPAAWRPEWLQYDYIGGMVPFGVDFWRGVEFGGCGGFSLRSKRLHEYMAAHCDWSRVDQGRHHEDFVICVLHGYQLGRDGFRLYPAEAARRWFSGEENRPYLGQFGHHKADLSTWRLGARAPEAGA
jgi:hypothetical protein